MATAQHPMIAPARPDSTVRPDSTARPDSTVRPDSTPPRRPTRLVLSGRVDAVEVPEVHRAAADLLAAGVTHVEVDLADVEFLDSAGLAALVRLRRECLAAGGAVTVVRPRSDHAMRVFRLTQLDRVFTMTDPPRVAATARR